MDTEFSAARFSIASAVTRRPLRAAVVATAHPRGIELLDALLAHAIDYDIIYVEPLARAYSRVRQAAPDLVIIHSSIEDAAACALRSMLKFDDRTSAVPVITCIMPGDGPAADEDAADDRQSLFTSIGAAMN